LIIIGAFAVLVYLMCGSGFYFDVIGRIKFEKIMDYEECPRFYQTATAFVSLFWPLFVVYGLVSNNFKKKVSV
jgi:hypothetical protein